MVSAPTFWVSPAKKNVLFDSKLLTLVLDQLQKLLLHLQNLLQDKGGWVKA